MYTKIFTVFFAAIFSLNSAVYANPDTNAKNRIVAEDIFNAPYGVAVDSAYGTANLLFIICVVEFVLLLILLCWSLYSRIKTKRLSERDALTKMYNRSKFNEIRERYTLHAPESLGIAFFDINQLKKINDTAGHSDGDALIKTAARCIMSVFGKYSYRIGGDEFVSIVPDISREEFYDKVAEVEALAAKAGCSISAGFCWRRGNCNFTVQLNKADYRMYDHKKGMYRKMKIKAKES